MDSYSLVDKIVHVLDKKKAEKIKAIKIDELTVLADYFIIASGTSNTHVHSLCEDVEDAVSSELGIEPKNIEGKATGWILIDYGDVVLHVFTPEQRAYYDLERLWSDAEELKFDDIES